jgi:hypothetical protein
MMVSTVQPRDTVKTPEVAITYKNPSTNFERGLAQLSYLSVQHAFCNGDKRKYGSVTFVNDSGKQITKEEWLAKGEQWLAGDPGVPGVT